MTAHLLQVMPNDDFCTDVGFATLRDEKCEVLTGGGAVRAYASVVDNHTGDATTIPVQQE